MRPFRKNPHIQSPLTAERKANGAFSYYIDMRVIEYDRRAAFAYAKMWAFRRNPRFYNFDGLGGDCTNFASQCIYAGAGIMNYTPTFGWYYKDLNNRAPAWTGVEYLYNFMTTNEGKGPFARRNAAEQTGSRRHCAGLAPRRAIFTIRRLWLPCAKAESMWPRILSTHL